MWDVISTKVLAGYTELVDDLVTEKWIQFLAESYNTSERIQHDRANP